MQSRPEGNISSSSPTSQEEQAIKGPFCLLPGALFYLSFQHVEGDFWLGWKYFERLNLEPFLVFHSGETLNPSLASACAWTHPPICVGSDLHIILFLAARSTYPNLSLNTTKLTFVLDFSSEADTTPETEILALKAKLHVACPE